MARLKVYRTPAGFEDALVAAPSRKAALRAWGSRADLFALGEADVVDDPAVTAEALARPGEVIRRPRGDARAFLAAASPPKPSKAAATVRTAKSKPMPDRSHLDAAEAMLTRAEADLDARRRELDGEREALEARAAKMEAEAKRRLATLQTARDKARADYDAVRGR